MAETYSVVGVSGICVLPCFLLLAVSNQDRGCQTMPIKVISGRDDCRTVVLLTLRKTKTQVARFSESLLRLLLLKNVKGLDKKNFSFSEPAIAASVSLIRHELNYLV